MDRRSRALTPADVCLVLEGTYPFARGGVSVWADLLIRRLPDLSFHLWCAVPRRDDAHPAWELPPNVTGVTVLGLLDAPAGPSAASPAFLDAVRALHEQLSRGDDAASDALHALMTRSGSALGPDALLGRDAYRLIVELCAAHRPPLPLLDFFHGVLAMHGPLFAALRAPAPPAHLYHAACTGYAGLLGCRAKREWRAPLVVTEHGIYTNERHLEIALSDWMRGWRTGPVHLSRPPSDMRTVWTAMFEHLGRLAYREADAITTLFEGNRAMQLRLGAPPAKIQLIPNGVDLGRWATLPRRTRADAPAVALVGRVVPIKDVRTFIRACRILGSRFPAARFLVVGGTDDPGYLERCRSHAALLGLSGRLTFAGEQVLDAVYPELDAVVLTSLSEGQPLVLLEAMAAGVPVVATRVGACAELLEGADPADRATGPAGLVVDVGDHEHVAEAVGRILTEPGLAAALGDAGRKRARARYDLDRVVARYRALYEQVRAGRRAA